MSEEAEDPISFPNPFTRLLHSRKFWLLILATIINLTTLGLTTFTTKEVQVFAGAILVSLDAVFVFVINAVTQEDVAWAKHDAEIAAAEIYAAAQVEMAKTGAVPGALLEAKSDSCESA